MEEGREKVCVCECVSLVSIINSTPFYASNGRNARIFLNGFPPPLSLFYYLFFAYETLSQYHQMSKYLENTYDELLHKIGKFNAHVHSPHFP